jgi:deoxyribonuclease-4
LAAAAAVGAETVQFFLADPQGWKAPKRHEHFDAIKASTLPVYIHAPYLVNVATLNNRIRFPSRKILAQHAEAAAAIGANALIVHAGYVNASDELDVGIDNWRKTFARVADEGGYPLPILIENTAGGNNSLARRFDRLARLWDAIGEYGPGFVLDPCHAHAGGEQLDGIVERVRKITGRLDLVHANNSRDAFDSGADRHANLNAGQIDPKLIAAIAKEAGTDVLVETPAAGHADDIAFLKESLASTS